MPVDEGEADSGKNRLFGEWAALVGTKIGMAKKSTGSTVLSAAVTLVEEFDAMHKEQEIKFKGLNEWLESLAMFVVDPEAMSRAVDVQTRILEQRKKNCGSKYTLRKLSPRSLRTCVYQVV